MDYFSDMINDDRFIKLENKATKIRKVLLGVLLLAKDIWRDELEQKQGGIEVIKALEEAEEAFIDNSLTDRFERLENILNVIYTRSKGIYKLMEYLSKDKKSKELFKPL